MQTERARAWLVFEAVRCRRVVAGFDGGAVTSDAGALLLGYVDPAALA
ncbi:MAG: hypothetical protein ACE5Q3_19950 [Alphaproteobacteria bacterium]